MFRLKCILIFFLAHNGWIVCRDGDDLNHLNHPPVAEEIPRISQIHGQHLEDEYAWIRDANWPDVTDEKILRYLKAENEYADKFFASPVKEEEEVAGGNDNDYVFVTVENVIPRESRDGWTYYEKRASGKEYPIRCRKYKNDDGPEQVILDENEIALGHEYTVIEAVTVSSDHAYVAYAVDHVGDEKFTIKVRDLNDNSYLPDEIRPASSSIVWHEKISGFFYISVKDKLNDDRVFFHHLRKDERDKFVFGVPNGFHNMAIEKSSSRKYMFINISNHNTNEYRAVDITADDEKFPPFLIKENSPGIFYDVTHAADKFYARTNRGAENFKVISAPEDRPSNWDDTYVAESDGYLKKIEATAKYLIMTYLENALPVIKLKRFEDGDVKSVAFPEASYSAHCYTTNYGSNDVRISYSSLRRPFITYTYDYDSGKLNALVSQRETPEADDYAVEFIAVASGDDEDGNAASIPVSILYRKSLFQKDGTNPAYIHGYGAYAIGLDGHFRGKAMALASVGFVYAVAHVRGGDERGSRWYESGKLLNKKRTFQDFITVAEALVAEKYTAEGNVVANSESAGAMMIGAVLNQRPTLFKAAVVINPYVDVLNTLLDESLPLTPTDHNEFGDPIRDPRYYHYIKSYCPYQNVKEQDYPSIFVTASLSDHRVGYWEAAKWVARLRKRKTNDNVVLLKTNMNGGHLLPDGIANAANEMMEELDFIFRIFGIV